MQSGDVVAERFEIERLAGTGGMGAVFRARDRLTGETVALKSLFDPAKRNIERFVQEGRLLADLRHPGIVRYVAHGTTPAGEPYLAMEWLDGEDLSSRLSRAGLSVKESVALVRRVAESLAAAHVRGIVHRDVKPSNLFLQDGEIDRVRVLDFGIARLRHATRAHTATGALLGTPGYMAPEQALGEAHVDARADVFALGCVFYECLTGKPVFAAEHMMALLAKIVLEDAPRVKELRPALPDSLDDLVARMLSKDPAGRPADGAGVVAKIDALERLPIDESRTRPSSGFNARITEREQRVVSVVLAGADTHAGEIADAATIAIDAATKTVERMRRVVAPYGARFEWLADGSLVGTLAGHGTAMDEAAQAARCALAIRARLIDVPIVLATGRGFVAGRLPMGQVIDRATRLLRGAARRAPAEGAVEHSPPIRLDDVTAGLLDSRFDVGGDDAGLVLLGEREQLEVTRKLLGKATPCVGRDRELKMLEAIFAECVAEPVARTVLVTAPAGFGKSRLRYEFVRELKKHKEPIEIWFGRGDPMSAGSPFAILAQALRGALGIRDGEALAVRHQKLRARVARHVPSDDASRVAEFLGELVGAPFPESTSVQLRAARAEPVLIGDQMRRAWEDFLSAESKARPVLLVLEDFHWGDLPTVRFVDAALRNLHDHPVMVLAHARPEVHDTFPRLWAERRMQEIRLEELTRKAGERLVREVLGDGVSAETVAQLVTRSAGNVFYLEELVRAVAEGKGDALPETVLAMAQARLDALDPEARRLLRGASVFGDTFWRGGVIALLGGERRAVQAREWLDDLTVREIITPRPEAKFAAEVEYGFRHAIVREVAYASLTDSDKKLGHKLAAEWLEKIGERDAMVLAEHYERGGEPPEAVRWYLEAAEHALRGDDFAATIARADRGIACGATGETLGAFRLLQAEAHRWIGEFSKAELRGEEAFAHLPPRSALWFAAAGELVSACGLVSNHERLVALSVALREAGATGEASPALVIASARAAVQLLHAGKYAMVADFIDWLEEAARPLVASDPAVAGWIGRARTIQAGKSGDTQIGCAASEASAAHLEAAGDMRTACLQRMNLGYYQNELGMYREAEQTLRSALAQAERIGLHHVTAPGKTFLAYALGGLGEIDEGKTVAREAAETFASQGDRRMEAASRNHLARMLLAAGDAERAAAEARLAVTLCEAIPAMRASSLGSLALALLDLGKPGEALASAREGMTLLASLGGMDQGEARLRLAFALGLDAAGDRAGASDAIEAARERLVTRAAKMSDHSWRESFLEGVPENAATMKLAREWVDAHSGRPT